MKVIDHMVVSVNMIKKKKKKKMIYASLNIDRMLSFIILIFITGTFQDR